MTNHFKFKYFYFFLCISYFLSLIWVNKSLGFLPRPDMTGSFHPVGQDARAFSMGGAFIAIADNASASDCNPAGLIQLDRSEISVAGSFSHLIEKPALGIIPDDINHQTVSDFNLNYISLVFADWHQNLVLSVNYHKLYSFDREWNFYLLNPDHDISSQNIDYKSKGYLTALGIACAIRVNESISFGLTFNFWQNNDLFNNSWHQKVIQSGKGVHQGDAFIEHNCSLDRFTFKGVNLNIGFLWKQIYNSGFSFGAVLKTKFKGNLDVYHDFSANIKFPDLPEKYNFSYSQTFNEEASLIMPMSYGLGLAYRFSDSFTTSIDIFKTHWEDVVYEDARGVKSTPITGKPTYMSNIQPTIQVRMGAEYFLYETQQFAYPLCFGLFYDPAPAEGRPDDYYGISCGFGIADKQNFSFDFAYQFRFGNNVGTSVLKSWSFSQDIHEHHVYSSIIFYF
ncbi:Membrane protein involved in aromatic hydrocarbon degradation [Candidatus Magnetomorum sp. HK-1]|nr:Membrane protein involved in aromatic hydrocarbon degradation [Candidatus Magnetomorum sp. HK-1]